MPAASMARQRLFIAIPCPLTPRIAAALDELRAAQQHAASGLRVVNADTLHITLAFLGAVDGERIDATATQLDDLANARAPRLTIRGAGYFTSALWLGVGSDASLPELAQRCETGMRALGFALDERTFHPHVTVARLKHRPGFDCKAWCAAQREMVWSEYVARELHLYRSETLGDGARYSIIHSVTLL